jgi:protease YdgD
MGKVTAVIGVSVSVLFATTAFAMATDAGNAANFDPLAKIKDKSVLRNVFTDDKRVQVTNTEFPWSAVGKLDNADGSYCTATLVGRRLIVTAAHCIMEKGELVQGHYVFTPEYGNGGETSAGVEWFWWGTKTPNSNRGNDWALLKLDADLGDQFGWMGVQALPIAKLLNRGIFSMSAYSSDFGDGEVASAEGNCTFKRWVDNTLHHNCDASRGSSGASMFYTDRNKKVYVVAVNVAEFRGSSDHSYIGVPYSDSVSNVAIPASTFLGTLKKIK